MKSNIALGLGSILFGLLFYWFLSDSRYRIVQTEDGKFSVEHVAMFGLYKTDSMPFDTIDEARNSRDNNWNPTNKVVRIVE